MHHTPRTAIAAVALLACAQALAVPVIPGAAGFGIETPAGRGGTVHRVTTLAASGTGSLAACIGASGPRVCVFEVSGAIRVSQDLEIRNGFITIAGQTAPSPGIVIVGGGISVQTSEVLVQHLRVRVGDDRNGPDPVSRAAFKVEGSGRQSNIVADHLSLSWGTDQTASVYWDWDNVTFRSTIFGPALHDSIHPSSETDPNAPAEPHGMGPMLQLVASGHPASAAMIGNLFVHQYSRNPLALVPRFVFVNNVVYNAVDRQVDLSSPGGAAMLASLVGNVFIKGPDSARVWRPIIAGSVGSAPLASGSRVYVADNLAAETTSDPWSVVVADARSSIEASTAPVWPAGLVALKTANNGVLNAVLANVGARPADRDSYDRGLISQVQNKTGTLINCVSADGSSRCQKNAGGWPQLAQNTRALSLPANPSQMNADGYTNLEKWLHGMAAQVEGGTVPTPSPPTINPRPPTNLRVE